MKEYFFNQHIRLAPRVAKSPPSSSHLAIFDSFQVSTLNVSSRSLQNLIPQSHVHVVQILMKEYFFNFHIAIFSNTGRLQFFLKAQKQPFRVFGGHVGHHMSKWVKFASHFCFFSSIFGCVVNWLGSNLDNFASKLTYHSTKKWPLFTFGKIRRFLHFPSKSAFSWKQVHCLNWHTEFELCNEFRIFALRTNGSSSGGVLAKPC